MDMYEEHYTVEDFRKCEILREKGYKVEAYPFKYKRYIEFWYCRDLVPFPYTTTKLIAYKGDMENITQEFAEKHLIRDVFDRVVAGKE